MVVCARDGGVVNGPPQYPRCGVDCLGGRAQGPSLHSRGRRALAVERNYGALLFGSEGDARDAGLRGDALFRSEFGACKMAGHRAWVYRQDPGNLAPRGAATAQDRDRPAEHMARGGRNRLAD